MDIKAQWGGKGCLEVSEFGVVAKHGECQVAPDLDSQGEGERVIEGRRRGGEEQEDSVQERTNWKTLPREAEEGTNVGRRGGKRSGLNHGRSVRAGGEREREWDWDWGWE